MNISGAGVNRAWRTFLTGLDPAERDHAVLVVVHDEMEVALGAVKVKKTGSAGGHKGLISIIAALGTKVCLDFGFDLRGRGSLTLCLGNGDWDRGCVVLTFPV